MFSVARARSSMIFEARNSSRRLTIVTLRGELGEEDRLLHRGVAAADDDRRAVLEERGVAGRAVGHAAAAELLLAGHAELLVLGAHREDHGAGLVGLVVDPDGVRLAVGAGLDAWSTLSVMKRVPKRSAWSRNSCIISGPMMPCG